MAMTIAIIILSVALVIALACIGRLVYENRQIFGALQTALKVNEENNTINEANRAIVEARTTVAQQYVDACKLIDIQPNGRLTLFTFSRHDEFFTLELIRQMSDDIRVWRLQAGLDN